MLELNRIYNMDCLDGMRQLEDKSIDLVLTDPPYGHNNNNNGDLISRWEAALGCGDYIPERDNRPILNDGETANNLFRACLPEFHRLLKPGGNLCCCCCGGGGPDPQFARWSLWIDEIIPFKMCVVWDKGGLGMGWHYRRNWECILVATKSGAACKWYGGNDVPNVISDIPKIIPSSEQHPTIKPVALMEHFIRLHTEENDVVLDPFIGSGTTVEACIRSGRQFIGFELDKRYFDSAQIRIKKAQEQGKIGAWFE